jgi:hypothetical protein
MSFAAALALGYRLNIFERFSDHVAGSAEAYGVTDFYHLQIAADQSSKYRWTAGYLNCELHVSLREIRGIISQCRTRAAQTACA